MDLIVEDDSRLEAVFSTMSEENVRREIQQPWISFCSDAGSIAPEGIFLGRHYHPRAYGAFARVLGRYVREEKRLPLAEAIWRLSSLPAENLKLDRRGRLAAGYYADVVVFDPARVQDQAACQALNSKVGLQRRAIASKSPGATSDWSGGRLQAGAFTPIAPPEIVDNFTSIVRKVSHSTHCAILGR
jgi:N-acyl-D-aspartate/D-glutamate deacylase